MAPAVATLEVGAAVQLTASIETAAGAKLQRPVQWRSSDVLVATVDPAGLVTAVAGGRSMITATSEGVTGSAAIDVLPAVASLAVAPGSATLRLGETLALAAVPKDAGGAIVDRRPKWTSSNPSVVTVDGRGVVFAVGVGSTTVTAAIGAVSGSAAVLVRSPVGSVVVSPAVTDILVGQTVAMQATVLDPAGAPLAVPVTWTSHDPTIALVDLTGVVTSVSQGNAAIAATADGTVGIGVVR
ncbi:MAG: Ig domain-containing protein, partial [Gemmatimonadales bacterium]